MLLVDTPKNLKWQEQDEEENKREWGEVPSKIEESIRLIR